LNLFQILKSFDCNLFLLIVDKKIAEECLSASGTIPKRCRWSSCRIVGFLWDVNIKNSPLFFRGGFHQLRFLLLVFFKPKVSIFLWALRSSRYMKNVYEKKRKLLGAIARVPQARPYKTDDRPRWWRQGRFYLSTSYGIIPRNYLLLLISLCCYKYLYVSFLHFTFSK
jgi:hypothetical protein